MKEYVIYKAVFGNYDSIDNIDSEHVDSKTDYFMISDVDINLPNPWKLIKVDRQFTSNAKENRYYKMNGHPFFSKYKYSVYLDGNVNIKGDLTALLNTLNEDFDIHAYRHPKRNSISDELKACVIYNKITIAQYRESLSAKYNKYKHTHQNMFECNVLIKRITSNKLEIAMKDWFDLFCTNLPRDQIYFPYILEAHDIAINSLGTSDLRDSSKIFAIKAHSHKAPWFDRKKVLIYRKLNKIFKWF